MQDYRHSTAMALMTMQKLSIQIEKKQHTQLHAHQRHTM